MLVDFIEPLPVGEGRTPSRRHWHLKTARYHSATRQNNRKPITMPNVPWLPTAVSLGWSGCDFGGRSHTIGRCGPIACRGQGFQTVAGIWSHGPMGGDWESRRAWVHARWNHRGRSWFAQVWISKKNGWKMNGITENGSTWAGWRLADLR